MDSGFCFNNIGHLPFSACLPACWFSLGLFLFSAALWSVSAAVHAFPACLPAVSAWVSADYSACCLGRRSGFCFWVWVCTGFLLPAGPPPAAWFLPAFVFLYIYYIALLLPYCYFSLKHYIYGFCWFWQFLLIYGQFHWAAIYMPCLYTLDSL